MSGQHLAIHDVHLLRRRIVVRRIVLDPYRVIALQEVRVCKEDLRGADEGRDSSVRHDRMRTLAVYRYAQGRAGVVELSVENEAGT